MTGASEVTVRRLLLLVISGLAVAGCGSAGATEVVVRDAWSPPTPPITNVAAFYLTIHNPTATGDALVGATSPSCDEMQIHESVVTGDVASMGELTEVSIAADADIVFEPNGLHLMCLGVTKPVEVGDTIAVTLDFERSRLLEIEVVGDDR